MSIKKDYISIIIPVYNEENNIGKLIDNLEKFTGHFEVFPVLPYYSHPIFNYFNQTIYI